MAARRRKKWLAMLGLKTRYNIVNGNIMAGPLPIVCADIAAGKADTVVMMYAAASRAIGRQYGGQTYTGDQTGTPSIPITTTIPGAGARRRRIGRWPPPITSTSSA